MLPDPNNRVYWHKKGKLRFDFTPNNFEAHDRLVYQWIEVLKKLELEVDCVKSNTIFPRGEAPISVVGYQLGTCRMGADPSTSVLDINCRTHDIDNLYVVDSSFFPSCPAVGPALTIMANALRVGDHLMERLKG
jgi:choline dehydrogenase-like flavoprotein